MVGIEILADTRVDTGQSPAGRLNLRIIARQAIHVGRWAPKISDMTGEAWGMVPDRFEFTNDGIFRSILDDAALMFGDGAEAAATKASPHDGHRVLNHFKGRNLFLAIGLMRLPGIGEVINCIHFPGGQRDWRRIDPHIAFAMPLHQGSGIAGIGFLMKDSRSMSIEDGILLDLIIAWEPDDGFKGVEPSTLKSKGCPISHFFGAAAWGFHLIGIHRGRKRAWGIHLCGVDQGKVLREVFP